ncbi:MAG: hypothetical protein KY439_01175 [Actinobacteria bacterium]|nr:hypothetical protein [Actinomycetota bacterium]
MSDFSRFHSRLSTLVSSFVSDFEERMGYPPGSNRVSLSTAEESSVALVAEFGEGALPMAILNFFNYFSEIHLPDFWNGYFIGPPSWIVSIHQASEPRSMDVSSREEEILVFGSDGGGALFVVPTSSGSPVYRLPPSLIEGGTYRMIASADPSALIVSNDFDDFLEEFLGGLEEFVAHGSPGPFWN